MLELARHLSWREEPWLVSSGAEPRENSADSNVTHTEHYRDFYEAWAKLRTDELEADYNNQACAWKWSLLEGLIRRRLTPQSILEFGCGSGEMLGYARNAFPGAELHGVDISERMLEMALERLGNVRTTRGGEEALEAYQPRVDLVLAVDILEHLVEPERAVRALATAGRYVALKIPLERRRIRLGIRRQRVGTEHIAGHLHFWTAGDARRLLTRSGLRILEEFTADPPESIRYHATVLRQEPHFAGTPLGLLRKAHHRLEVALERSSCAQNPTLHAWLFGTNHFVLAEAA